MSNLKLKAVIIEKFGSQSNFSQEIKVREPVISRVINNRHSLSQEERER